MTIELLTGAPGAGKTTYMVARRLAPEVGRQFEMPSDECLRLGLPPGTMVNRGLVQAGIKGLLVEHERIPHILTGEKVSEEEIGFWNALHDARGGDDLSGTPVFNRLPADMPWDHARFDQEAQRHPDRPAGWFRPSLFNWWLWALPGQLIAIDEVQFIVPRGTVGRKPPLWIALLEIHRHYGIDFLFVTQHPQLLDSTIRALVGMHRHVRRVMAGSLCVVYVWDHASNPERYQLANKEKFLRGAKDYALFKSSVLHAKPPSSGRSIFWMFPLLLCIAGGLGFSVYSHVGGKSRTSAATDAASVSVEAGASSALAASAKTPAIQAPSRSQSVRVAGCWATPTRCECVADSGQPLYLPEALCRKSSVGFAAGSAVAWQPQESPRDLNYGAGAKSVDHPASGSLPSLRESL